MLSDYNGFREGCNFSMPDIPHKAAKNTEGCVIFKGMLSALNPL